MKQWVAVFNLPIRKEMTILVWNKFLICAVDLKSTRPACAQIYILTKNKYFTFNLQIIFHGTDRESLHKHLCKSCLPECYGGTLDVARITGPQWYELLLLVEKEFFSTYTLHREINAPLEVAIDFAVMRIDSKHCRPIKSNRN